MTKTIQQPRIIYRKASHDNSHTKTSANIADGINNETISIDDHEEPFVADSQDQAIVSNG